MGAGAGSRSSAAVAARSRRVHASSGPAGHSEPRGPHRPRVGGEAIHVLRDAAILRDRPTDEDAREDGGCRRDPECRAERSATSASETTECERDDVAAAGHGASDPCRRRYARAFSRPPQICIEHQLDERLREPS